MEPPKILLEQLAVGGRLIMPLGEQGDQFIYLIDKIKDNKIVYSKNLLIRRILFILNNFCIYNLIFCGKNEH